MRDIRELKSDDRGGTLIEYGLILALIFVVMLGAVQIFATKVTGTLNYVGNEVSNAGNT